MENKREAALICGFPFGILMALQRQFKGTDRFCFKGAVPGKMETGLEVVYGIGEGAAC